MFKKEVISKEAYIISIAGKEYPLEAITNLIKTVSIAIFMYLAYNVGQSNAWTLINFTLDHCSQGISMPDGSTCKPVLIGSEIKYTNCNASPLANLSGLGVIK